MAVVVNRQRNSPFMMRDVIADIAEGLASRVPNLAPGATKTIAQALHELLDGQDEASRNLRMGMQHYLIEIAELQGRATRKPSDDRMLTTEAAAELMQCSRPYVAMLIDNKKLAGSSLTEGGHRRVPESSVRAWIAEREAKAKQSDYRATAAETGMYSIPETAFIVTKARRRS
jgi:excisionase family DNA binding protein